MTTEQGAPAANADAAARTKPARIHADRAAGTLELEWADGHKTTYTAHDLRWLCPCALCRGEAGLRSLAGGEIHEYTALLEDTRRQALDRLVKNATLMGANAVISMRFDSSELAGTMSEIVAYGTAVVVEPDASARQATD